MSTAVATAVELVTFAPESKRALGLFAALEAAGQAQGLDVTRTEVYRGTSPWLLLWGPGAPARAAVLRRHVAAGGRGLVFDLAYWDRDRKARVSIDSAHPQAWVMRETMPSDRFLADRVPVSDTWKPKGPVIIAGIGDKARVQYGAGTVDAWERSMIEACRSRWPGRQVVYRKKKASSPVTANVQTSNVDPIDKALTGASLVVTWHSNVAVDAIRMGIPVICRDGAAAAVFQPALGDKDPLPLPTELRDRFLANLAYFQWGSTPDEATKFWAWAQRVLA